MDQRKLNSLIESHNEEQDILQKIRELEEAVKPYLTKDAFERYQRVKLAHPKIAIDAIIQVVRTAKERRIAVMDDTSFREMLRTHSDKRNITIRR